MIAGIKKTLTQRVGNKVRMKRKTETATLAALRVIKSGGEVKRKKSHLNSSHRV